jgi:hypothetical protein
MLGNHYLRSNGRWGAHSKTLHRRLTAADARLAERIDAAFARALAGEIGPLLAVTDDVLWPTGGRLFERYTARSEPEQRRKPPAR